MTSQTAHRAHPACPVVALAINAAVPAWNGTGATFRVEEAAWGCRVCPRAGRPPILRLAQGAALVAGAAALGAGLLLAGPALGGLPDLLRDAGWLVPPGAGWDLRAGLGALAAAALLLWLATRGASVELQVDRRRREVRLVVPNLVGRPRLLAAHGFDAVAGLRVAPAGRHFAALVIDARGGRPLPVASGTRADLAPLRRRLERDLAQPQMPSRT